MKTKRNPGASPKPAAPQVDPSAAVAAPPASTRKVRFDVHLGGAREVHVAGTFNDWHPTTLPMIDMGLGRWEKEILLEPGVYEYLFVADGRWLPDPNATGSVPNPHGGVNSLLHVA
jgi:1,4-alpha-glucan branching enzyme